jgi:transposase
MSKSPVVVGLEPDQREVLEQWVRAHGTPQQVAKRYRIVLLAHQGHIVLEIAEELGVNRHTCRLWRERFMAEGPDGLWEVAEGRGRRPEPGLAERIGLKRQLTASGLQVLRVEARLHPIWHGS